MSGQIPLNNEELQLLMQGVKKLMERGFSMAQSFEIAVTRAGWGARITFSTFASRLNRLGAGNYVGQGQLHALAAKLHALSPAVSAGLAWWRYQAQMAAARAIGFLSPRAGGILLGSTKLTAGAVAGTAIIFVGLTGAIYMGTNWGLPTEPSVVSGPRMNPLLRDENNRYLPDVLTKEEVDETETNSENKKKEEILPIRNNETKLVKPIKAVFTETKPAQEKNHHVKPKPITRPVKREFAVRISRYSKFITDKKTGKVYCQRDHYDLKIGPREKLIKSWEGRDEYIRRHAEEGVEHRFTNIIFKDNLTQQEADEFFSKENKRLTKEFGVYGNMGYPGPLNRKTIE